MTKTRLAYIDLLRAYAIFLVTGYHLWRFMGEPSGKFFIYDIFAIFHKGSAGVELFFFISGFSMALITYQGIDSHKTIDWQRYFLKRLFRIIPAYYVAIIIWTILISNGVAPKSIGLIDQISHLLFIHTFNPQTYYSISGVFWSLGIEMQFYFLLPLLLYFIIRFPKVSILLFVLPLFYNSFVENSFLLQKTVFAFFIYFIVGYVLFMYKEKLYALLYENNYKSFVLALSIFLFLNLTFYKGHLHSGQIHTLLWLCSVIGIFIFMMRCERCNNTKNKLMQLFLFTGTASYSIYLYNYIYFLHAKPFDTSFEAVVFYTLLVYLTGSAMYYIVEKPFQNLRKKTLDKIHLKM